MAIVTFSYDAWAARYPELASSVNAALAGLYFSEASIYCDNSDASPIADINVRTVILNQLTAHIAALNAPLGGQPASPLVGRISQATEGSVSVQTQMDLPPGSAQWFAQTKYGAAAWQAMSPYRMAQYFPGCPRVMDPYAPFGYPQ
jgi:hypothetical protein